MKRVMPFIAGAVLLALAAESAYGLFIALRASERVELAGIGVMVAVAMAVIGVGLVRHSIFGVLRSAGGTYILYLFGYGWLMGVLVNAAITQVRATRPTYDSPLAVALDVFSWLAVTLILAIPGLISLVIARRLCKTSLGGNGLGITELPSSDTRICHRVVGAATGMRAGSVHSATPVATLRPSAHSTESSRIADDRLARSEAVRSRA